jgi:hypothetical protein
MQKNRGGARDGAGRPRMEKGTQSRRNITLSDRLAKKAKRIGNGNISEGIRRALETYISQNGMEKKDE